MSKAFITRFWQKKPLKSPVVQCISPNILKWAFVDALPVPLSEMGEQNALISQNFRVRSKFMPVWYNHSGRSDTCMLCYCSTAAAVVVVAAVHGPRAQSMGVLASNNAVLAT